MKSTHIWIVIVGTVSFFQHVLLGNNLHGTEHVVVYGQPGRFGGWPANHGIWSWGDEILVGFSIGYHKDLGTRHNIDRERPEHHVLARSLNGGKSWEVEYPAERGMLINAGGMRHGTTDPTHQESEPISIREKINFKHPDFCLTTRFKNVDGGESRLYYSYDRGKTWKGPFRLPLFGQPGVMARTDYLIDGTDSCTLMLTASKRNREEGRVFCGRTMDGGISWKFVSYVGPEPTGFSIMPSTVRLSSDRIVTTTRRREGPGEEKRRWIDAWASNDDGANWSFLGNPVGDLGEGNPPSLIKLSDGRLCLTYGDRKPPFKIYAKLSSDEGKSWGQALELSEKGAGRDMGYVRSVQRTDGRVVSVYYMQPTVTDYRQILATIWDPGSKN